MFKIFLYWFDFKSTKFIRFHECLGQKDHVSGIFIDDPLKELRQLHICCSKCTKLMSYYMYEWLVPKNMFIRFYNILVKRYHFHDIF